MCLAFGMRAVNYWKEGCLTYISISPKPNYSPVSARMSKQAEEAGAEGRARVAFVKFRFRCLRDEYGRAHSLLFMYVI